MLHHDRPGTGVPERGTVTVVTHGAKMSRTNVNGNLHLRTNDPDGTFLVSTDDKATTGQPSTARGPWTLDPEGRFGVVILWRRVNDAKWCRVVYRTFLGYFLASGNKKATEKGRRFEIGR